MPSFGDTLIPLWSMPFGCEGGLEVNYGRLTVIKRELPKEYDRWILDLSDGRVLDRPEKPVDPERLPADTHVEISGQSLNPLRPSLVRPVTPDGFDPVVVTDKFIFAKKTWLSFAFPKFIPHSQVIVVDRSSRGIVWHLEDEVITVQALPTHIIVCGQKRIAAFLPLASRPQEITDFYTAIRSGDTKKVAMLFDAWKRTPLYDLDGFDPLTLAAKEGKVEVVKQLLALKLSPNSKTADGYSPLLQALYDHPEIVSLLLDAGADPNYHPRDWDYPLTRAAESGSRTTIEHLLKNGAVINATDRWMGQTALHEAVMYRNYVAIETLLAAGADPHIRDCHGDTAEGLAYKDECITHLFSGGKIKDKPNACAPIHTETGTVTFHPY
jgi:hypothetical protein